MTYEEAIKQLEEILSRLESESISLDEATALFEKSVELSKFCFEKIKQTEGKVQIIKKQLDALKVEDFTDIEN